MARAQSEKVGRGECPSCASPVMYRKSMSGLLSHKCDECDSTGFADPGGAAYKKRIASIKGIEQDPEPTNPKESDPPPATPPAKRKNFAFDQL